MKSIFLSKQVAATVLSALRRGLFAALMLALITRAVLAQTPYYYNPPVGGAGSWDTTGSTNWSTTPAGPAGVAWLNDGTAIANFGNTAGIVTLGSAINAYGLNFLTGTTAGGYVINGGGNTLTLGGVGNINSDLTAATSTINAQIAGSVGLSKTGLGLVTLGGANTYTGVTTVTSGYLNGVAQVAGSPFSSGSITLNGAGVRLLGASGATTTTTVGDLNVSAPNNTSAGVSTLVVDNTGATGTTFALGNLNRGGAGSALVITPQNGTLGSGENVTFANGNALLTNNILPAWVIATGSGINPAADFVGYGGSGVTVATYNSTDLATSTATSIVDQSSPPSIAGNVLAYALRTNAAISLGGNTLTLGNGSGQSGLILNNSSSISNGTIDFGAAEGMIYAQNSPTLGLASDTTTVKSNGLNITVLDAGGITVNAAINDGTAPSKLNVTGVSPGTTVTLNGASNYTGGTTLSVNTDSAGGVVVGSNSAFGTGKVTYVPAPGTSTLQMRSGITSAALANAFDLNGNLTFNGANSIALNGAITIINPATNGIRTIANSASVLATLGDSTTPSTITLGNPSDVGKGIVFIPNTGTTTVINDVIRDPAGGSGGTVNHGDNATTSTGTVTVNGLNTYTGQTSFAGRSIVQFNHDYNVGDPSGPFGVGSNAVLHFDNTNNNNLQPLRRADEAPTALTRTVANPIVLNFGMTVSNAASDPSENLIFTGPITMLGAGRTMRNSFTANTGGVLTLGASANSNTWTMPTATGQTITWAGDGATVVNDTIQESSASFATAMSITNAPTLTFNGTYGINGSTTISGTNAKVTFNAPQTGNGSLSFTSATGATLTFTANGARGGTGSMTISGGSAALPLTVNLYAPSTYSGGTNLTGPNTVLNVGINTTGSPGAVTSGPFGTGAINVNLGTNQHFRVAPDIVGGNPVVTNRIIANDVLMTFGIAMESDPSLTGPDPNTLTFTGKFTMTSDRFISNGFIGASPNVAGNTGATMVLGDPNAPNQITLGNTTTGRLLSLAAQAGPIVVNDVIQDFPGASIPALSVRINNQIPCYAPVILNGASTYAGNTSYGVNAFQGMGAVLIGVSSVGSPGAITSGPFGKGTLTLNNTNALGAPNLVPYLADRTVANAITMTSNFIVSNSWTINNTNGGTGTVVTDPSGVHSLNLTGALTLGATSRTLTNNLGSGGTLTIGAVGGSAAMSIGSTLVVAGLSNSNTVINEAIGGIGGLTVQNGTVKLTNTNAYSGVTTVGSSTLFVNGSNTGAGAVNINSSSVLGGTGGVKGPLTITADVASGATLAPGSPDINSGIGTFTAGTTMTVNSNSTLNFDLGAAGAHDQINVTNTNGLTLSSTPNSISVNVTNLVGNLLAGGDYTLIDYNGVLNNGASSLHLVNVPSDPGYSFNLVNDPVNTLIKLSVTAPTPPGDWNGDTKINAADYVTWRKDPASFGNDPNGYVAWRENFSQAAAAGSGLDGPSAVPEPASFVLMLLSMVGLGAMHRRRSA